MAWPSAGGGGVRLGLKALSLKSYITFPSDSQMIFQVLMDERNLAKVLPLYTTVRPCARLPTMPSLISGVNIKHDFLFLTFRNIANGKSYLCTCDRERNLSLHRTTASTRKHCTC